MLICSPLGGLCCWVWDGKGTPAPSVRPSEQFNEWAQARVIINRGAEFGNNRRQCQTLMIVINAGWISWADRDIERDFGGFRCRFCSATRSRINWDYNYPGNEFVEHLIWLVPRVIVVFGHLPCICRGHGTYPLINVTKCEHVKESVCGMPVTQSILINIIVIWYHHKWIALFGYGVP